MPRRSSICTIHLSVAEVLSCLTSRRTIAGKFPEPDVKSLVDFRLAFDATFEVDHAQGARVIASNTRDNKFSPRNVIDGRRDTYWTTDDRITTPELTLNLSREQTFNVVRVRESLPLGQRVEAFAVDIWKNNDWQEFARGTSIGSCKLLRGKRVTTQRCVCESRSRPSVPQSLSSRFSLNRPTNELRSGRLLTEKTYPNLPNRSIIRSLQLSLPE
jgi:alpha-L-fucosidase